MSGDVRLDMTSVSAEPEIVEDAGTDDVTGDATFDTETQVPCDVDTPITNRGMSMEHSVNDVTLTTSDDVIAETEEKISRLKVELRFMHDENDNIRREQQAKLKELRQGYEVKIGACEQLLRNARETNDELREEVTVLTTKYESKCNDVKTLETAQSNLESLLQNKDEIIESQKLIIGGVRKQISDTDGVMSKSIIRNLEADRDELVNTVKTKDDKLGEYSAQVENLKSQLREKETPEDELATGERHFSTPDQNLSRVLEEKIALLVKAEELVSAKQDLLSAKDEIISNLKTIIRSKEATSACNKCEEGTHKVPTPDSASSAEGSSVPTTVKNGVKESCEFIDIHATNGVIINPMLLWVDIQRKMHPEDKWKIEAGKKFVKTEITEAKEVLWRVAGDTHIGKMVKRQGASKITAEVNDICTAFKRLAEKDSVPMFLSTSSMIARTPIYASNCTTCDPSSLSEQLNNMNESIGNIMNVLKGTKCTQQSGNGIASSKAEEDIIDVPLGGTIPITETMESAADAGDDGEPFETVTRKQKKGPVGSANIDLVIFGLPKNVTDERLKQVLSENNVIIKDSELLTKYEEARTYAYKVSVTKKQAEKIQRLNIWPERGGVRPYTLTYKKMKSFGSNTEPEQKYAVGHGEGGNSRNDPHRRLRQENHVNLSNTGANVLHGNGGNNMNDTLYNGQRQAYPVNLSNAGALQGQSPPVPVHMPYYYQPQAQVIPNSMLAWNRGDAKKWTTIDIPISNLRDLQRDGLIHPESYADRSTRQVKFVDRIGADQFSFEQ